MHTLTHMCTYQQLEDIAKIDVTSEMKGNMAMIVLRPAGGESKNKSKQDDDTDKDEVAPKPSSSSAKSSPKDKLKDTPPNTKVYVKEAVKEAPVNNTRSNVNETVKKSSVRDHSMSGSNVKESFGHSQSTSSQKKPEITKKLVGMVS
jgi:hypothetical protein